MQSDQILEADISQLNNTNAQPKPELRRVKSFAVHAAAFAAGVLLSKLTRR